jgi:hypothetical protein
MNLSEAVATNILLRALLGMPGGEGVTVVSDEEAEEAARFLAERARNALGGGVDSLAVATRWARRFRWLSPACERCSRIVDGEAWCQGCGEELCPRCWGEGDEFLCEVCRYPSLRLIEDVEVTDGAL